MILSLQNLNVQYKLSGLTITNTIVDHQMFILIHIYITKAIAMTDCKALHLINAHVPQSTSWPCY